MQNEETNITPLKDMVELENVHRMLATRPKVGSKRECAGRKYYIGKDGNWIREDGKREAKEKMWRKQRAKSNR